MYLNVDYIHSQKLTAPDIGILQLIKQQRTEDMEDNIATYINDDQFERFFEMGYIETIKGEKNDSEIARLRLTKKGTKLLENVEIPEITQGDLDMFDYLVDMYMKGDEDRVIGNKKKTKIYCTQFRNHLNLSLYEFYWLCWLFLDEYKFTKKLENIFFDSNKNRYGTFLGNIESSPLYQFLDENRERVEKFWEQKIKQ